MGELLYEVMRAGGWKEISGVRKLTRRRVQIKARTRPCWRSAKAKIRDSLGHSGRCMHTYTIHVRHVSLERFGICLQFCLSQISKRTVKTSPNEAQGKFPRQRVWLQLWLETNLLRNKKRAGYRPTYRSTWNLRTAVKHSIEALQNVRTHRQRACLLPQQAPGQQKSERAVRRNRLEGRPRRIVQFGCTHVKPLRS